VAEELQVDVADKLHAVSSIGSWSRQLARHIVEWPRVLSISSVRSRLTHHIIDGRVVLSIGSLSGQLASRDVTGPFVAFRVVVCVRQGGQWWQGMRKGYNGGTTKVVARPCAHCLGLPFHGYPLLFLFPFAFPSIERDDDRPTSLRRGEGHWVNFRGWEKTGHRGDHGGGGMKEG